MSKKIKEDKRLKEETTSKQTKPIIPIVKSIDIPVVKLPKVVKSTQAGLSIRVSEIQSLILQGYTRSYLIQYGSKWELSHRQIDDYIAMATVIIKEINLSTAQDNLAIVTTCLWDAFRSAKIGNNLAEQHKILMSIAKLKGLEQHTVNHIIEDKRQLENLSDTQLNAILEGKDE